MTCRDCDAQAGCAVHTIAVDATPVIGEVLAQPIDPVRELVQAATYAKIVAAVLPIDAAADAAVTGRLRATRPHVSHKLVRVDMTIDRAAAREMVRTAFDCAYGRAWPNARFDEVEREWGEWLRDEAPTAVKQLFGIVAP